MVPSDSEPREKVDASFPAAGVYTLGSSFLSAKKGFKMRDSNCKIPKYLQKMMPVAAAMTLFAVCGARAQDYYGQPGQQQGPSVDVQTQAGVDPPSQVGRISLVLGNVSVEPASVDQFSAAEVNYPLTTGDRLYADTASLAEVQTGQLALRAGQMTDVTLTAVTDTLTQFGLAQGSVHLRTYSIDAGTTVELDTPNVAVTVLQPGDVRVDVDAADDLTVVTLLSGQAEVDGNGLQQVMQPGESLQVSGSNPVSAQNVGTPQQDGLDRFSGDRDSVYASAGSEALDLNPETIGAEDLAGYGQWESEGDYGAVWYPSGVAADWQPYRDGHWTWIAPWGWTWVEAEPWGFAPFHYGRWNRFGDRWGWIPGPVFVRPVYSPALVVFLGGGGFGAGLTGWFPLGPGEVYTPWYHTSTLYLNRVNVSNIYNRNQREVRNNYNQRATNVYGNGNGDNRQYANRGVATVAMSQSNMAAGRRADQSNVRVNAGQLAGATVLPHPLVTPERGMVTGEPARAVPVRAERPTLASHEDTAIRAGGTMPERGPVMTNQPAPVQRQTQQPGQQGQRPVTSYRQPIQQQTQPSIQTQPQVQQQVQPQPQGRPVTSYRQPIQQQTQPSVQPQVQQPTQPTQPTQQGRPMNYHQLDEQRTQPVVQQPQTQEVVPAANQTSRPLFNKAVPPDPRPSFDQQRQAIQATDPGRPLSPQQLNNVRQNQPAGPPQQHEAPHPPPPPAPAPRSTPPPPPANKH
jgi:hypothetical protein